MALHKFIAGSAKHIPAGWLKTSLAIISPWTYSFVNHLIYEHWSGNNFDLTLILELIIHELFTCTCDVETSLLWKQENALGHLVGGLALVTTYTFACVSMRGYFYTDFTFFEAGNWCVYGGLNVQLMCSCLNRHWCCLNYGGGCIAYMLVYCCLLLRLFDLATAFLCAGSRPLQLLQSQADVM